MKESDLLQFIEKIYGEEETPVYWSEFLEQLDPKCYQKLIPHLHRACNLYIKRVEAQTLRDCSLETLNALPMGAILLNQNGKVLFYNRAAESILERNDGFSLDAKGSGSIAAGSVRETKALQKLIRDSIKTRPGQGEAKAVDSSPHGGAMGSPYPADKGQDPDGCAQNKVPSELVSNMTAKLSFTPRPEQVKEYGFRHSLPERRGKKLKSTVLGQGMGTVMKLTRSGSEHPLWIHITPLPSGQLSFYEIPCAVLFICDPENNTRLSSTVLANLYGLSLAEAQIARGLAMGSTVDSIAKEHRRSVNTIRVQLKQAFRKTNTHSQTDLVRLILSGPAMQC
ncbi:hypothetical protein F6R98_06710 [Candidatus Methylospira mobilis]|uniref:HTH luxR-type domain-containing protein n=1 Tax=Candidatus Methylospira mobilis TaxID=1808979 RepID=A0A5Q0BEQ9_9GAMM|nr:LuxR C-terminal-related transcriptional regulator [Candidatus Methylospira mobilis]QFY42355.1 hypothetical protein F6R98_06710 [Candidatus Methylospira mobilis]WNV04552.1 LuxR C-terminal-related transcriptional regulator [Candidatus Methylospira mobilis]